MPRLLIGETQEDLATAMKHFFFHWSTSAILAIGTLGPVVMSTIE